MWRNISEERFKNILTILMAVATVLITVIAYVQSDASARDDQANREAQRYQMEALGLQIRGNTEVGFATNVALATWDELDTLTIAASNGETPALASAYEQTRDRMTIHSPLLQPPYYDPESATFDVNTYEVDTYIRDVVVLRENFAAASAVKNAWDTKANTYIIHLTLLAVSLFFFGLATTLGRTPIRVSFAVLGVITMIVATGWMVQVYAEPVTDRRDDPSIIQGYADGYALSYVGKLPEAAAALDAVLAKEPTYIPALTARADIAIALEDREGWISYYEQARSAGDESVNTAGNLAWAYYTVGRLDDAIAMNQTAIALDDTLLWVRFDLALAYLAKGDVAAAQAEYQAIMQDTAAQVQSARAAGEEPSSVLWWSIDDAVYWIQDIVDDINGDFALYPLPQPLANAEEVKTTAETLIRDLKELSVQLEYAYSPTSDTPTAEISPFRFFNTVGVEEYEEGDYFTGEVYEVGGVFEYSGMQDRQWIVLKVFVDGTEDPFWRQAYTWAEGETGTSEILLNFGASSVYIFRPGFYTVELYVDSHLAQTGSFFIEAVE